MFPCSYVCSSEIANFVFPINFEISSRSASYHDFKFLPQCVPPALLFLTLLPPSPPPPSLRLCFRFWLSTFVSAPPAPELLSFSFAIASSFAIVFFAAWTFNSKCCKNFPTLSLVGAPWSPLLDSCKISSFSSIELCGHVCRDKETTGRRKEEGEVKGEGYWQEAKEKEKCNVLKLQHRCFASPWCLWFPVHIPICHIPLTMFSNSHQGAGIYVRHRHRHTYRHRNKHYNTNSQALPPAPS